MKSMKIYFVLVTIGTLGRLNFVFSQPSYKTYNTFSFFYIDNSEGYSSTALNSALNGEVTDEFVKKMTASAERPDNYLYMMGSNGDNPKQSNNVKSILGSEWLKKYLANTSREATYPVERQLLRENLTMNPVRIKKQVDVYLFLSGYALGQLSKKIEELPTPLFFPKEMGIYLNNNDLIFNIFLYCNKDAVEELTADKIRNYFLFGSNILNMTNYTLEIQQF